MVIDHRKVLAFSIRKLNGYFSRYIFKVHVLLLLMKILNYAQVIKNILP